MPAPSIPDFLLAVPRIRVIRPAVLCVGSVQAYYIGRRYTGTRYRTAMTPPAPDPRHLLPLTTQVFHILLVLADGERHGYAIMRDVEEQSGGQVRLGPGTLYGAIKRMLDQGVIEESARRPSAGEDDARRRYYRLTAFGRRVLTAEGDRLAELVRAVRARKLSPRTRTS